MIPAAATKTLVLMRVLLTLRFPFHAALASR
jgi:hypothetical protein